MNAQKKAEILYAKKAKLYQHVFIDTFRYQEGLKAFFESKSFFNGKNLTILDAGTGTGTLIQAIYKTLPKNEFGEINFTAFDISLRMLSVLKDWIKNENIKNVKIFQEDLLKLDTLENTTPYDIIMSAGMLEYISKNDFITALKLLKNKIKKNGKLLLFISKKSLVNLFIIKLWWKADLFSKEELMSYLGKSGFRKITFHTFPKQYDYLNLWGYIIEATK